MWIRINLSSEKPYYLNLETNETSWEIPETRVTDENWTYVTNSIFSTIPFFVNRKSGATLWYLPQPNEICNQITGLDWIGNSCYLDTSLICLFTTPNSYTDTMLSMQLKNFSTNNIKNCSVDKHEDIRIRSEIQYKLALIAYSIRGQTPKVETCVDLRTTISQCQNTSIEDFSSDDMQDSGEFISFITQIFPLFSTLENTTTVSNSEEDFPKESEQVYIDTITDKFGSIVQPIVNFESNESIQDFTNRLQVTKLDDENLYYHKGVGYNTTIKRCRIVDAPYLIFDLKRLTYAGYNKTRIQIPEKISLDSGKEFKLIGITLYQSRHYTAAILCDNQWYHYNDIPTSEIIHLGNFDNMVKKCRAQIFGTQFYYCQI